jgi:hypothetical protein
MEVPAAGHEVAEVLPALAIERHHLAVEDRLFDRQLFPHPTAEILKPLEDIAPLGPEPAFLPSHIEESTIAVVLGLEQPGGIIERLAPGGE